MSGVDRDRVTRPSRTGRLVRGLLWVALAVVAVWLLFAFVFPWVESRWYNPAVGVVTWLA